MAQPVPKLKKSLLFVISLDECVLKKAPDKIKVTKNSPLGVAWSTGQRVGFTP
jgi:hypothetical protein